VDRNYLRWEGKKQKKIKEGRQRNLRRGPLKNSVRKKGISGTDESTKAMSKIDPGNRQRGGAEGMREK